MTDVGIVRNLGKLYFFEFFLIKKAFNKTKNIISNYNLISITTQRKYFDLS